MAVRRIRGPLKVQPLWVRVERNRVKLALFVTGFVVMGALAAELVLWLPTMGLMLIAGVFGVLEGWRGLSDGAFGLLFDPVRLALWTGVLGGTVTAAYAFHVLRIPLERQLRAIGARWVPLGEMLPTKSALKDMSIAAGVDPAPKLYVLDSASINAFVIARGDARPCCIVTSGLTERFGLDEQRAVFANLLARYRAGDIQWATAVSALMAPVWRWRDWGLTSGDSLPLAKPRSDVSFHAGDPSGATYVSATIGKQAAAGAIVGGAVLLGLWAFFAYTLAVVVSELVAFGHRRSQLLSSVVADAEGMLLLKDPVTMLRALDKAVRADNRVKLALPMYAQLFYIWAGDDLVDDDDPEWERLARLREVVGVDGIADAERDSAAIVTESVGETMLVAPAAPRLDGAGYYEGSVDVHIPERTVEPWPDRATPLWVIGAAVLATTSMGGLCMIAFSMGPVLLRDSKLPYVLAVLTFIAGLATKRVWAVVLTTLAWEGVVVVASVGSPSVTSASGMWDSPQMLPLAAASLVAGLLGVVFGRAVFGSPRKARR